MMVKVAYDKANLAKPDEIAQMIERVENALGHVDILVNNAGIQFVSPIENFPAKFDAMRVGARCFPQALPVRGSRAAEPGNGELVGCSEEASDRVRTP